MATEHPVIRRFEAIAPIDNPSKGEAAIRSHIAQTLTGYGLEQQHIDGAGNLFVKVPGKLALSPLMLSAHMDSVPPCYGIEPVRDCDQRTGRPIIRSAGKTILGADDKSGIAVMLELARELSEEGFENNRPLEFFFSTEEEIGLNGAKGFDITQSEAACCYVLDGEGRVGMIFNAGPSQDNLQINVTGKASHAGIEPEVGLSAIQLAAEYVGRLSISPGIGRLASDLTCNLGVIEGGKANNVIAPDVLIKGEARSHSEEKLQALITSFEETAQAVVAACTHPGVTPGIELKTLRRYNHFFVPEAHPAILEVWKACQIHGVSPLIAPMNIGSDAHILNQNGLPTVVLGMGFHYSHSLGEFIYCEELAQVYQIVYYLVTH
ncbi:MAG: M20/M25/M40 family metallo-hydrolase [Vampirovibrionales bacterium]|nr:M20/M25/M40 family metallo-hydrolase [Vampirovibrionales bacterium]